MFLKSFLNGRVCFNLLAQESPLPRYSYRKSNPGDERWLWNKYVQSYSADFTSLFKWSQQISASQSPYVLYLKKFVVICYWFHLFNFIYFLKHFSFFFVSPLRGCGSPTHGELIVHPILKINLLKQDFRR